MSQPFDAVAEKQAKKIDVKPSPVLADDHVEDDLDEDELADPLSLVHPVSQEVYEASTPVRSPPVRPRGNPRMERRKGLTGSTPEVEADIRKATLGVLGIPTDKKGSEAPMILGARQMGEKATLHTTVGEGDADSIVLGTPTTVAEVALMTPDDLAKYPGNPDTAMPCGPQARPILLKAFGANWFYAKDVLLRGEWPETVSDEAPLKKSKAQAELLMWKLLALRNFEYDGILHLLRERYKTQERVRPEKDSDILDWGSAGSVTKTSDIDVNLGGKYNMQAVGDFNDEFRKRGWPFEAGTVFDVNVYCKDNMHGIGFQKMSDQAESLKQGQPVGTAVMTIDQEKGMTKDIANYEEDQSNQEVAAMVKLIRFMTHSGDWRGNPLWNQYKVALKCDDGTPVGEQPLEQRLKVKEAQTRYDAWRKDLADMKKLLVKAGAAATDTLIGIAEDHQHKTQDALDMQASNRLYELKIEKLKLLRQKLADLTAAVGVDNTLLILDTSIELRQTILEAGMFANEAMITAGASNFVVFGTQVGIKDKTIGKARTETGDKVDRVKIKLTEAQLYHAFTEQLADTIKEFGHFDRLDEGLYKGGKYLMRMTLAADQLSGVVPQAIPHYEALRTLGDFAMTAKNMDGTGDAINAVMEKAIKAHLKIADMTDKASFIKAVMAFGTGVVSAYQSAKAQVVVPDMPEPSDPDMIAKMTAYQKARNEKTGANLRLASVQGADLTKEIEKLSAGAVHAKQKAQ